MKKNVYAEIVANDMQRILKSSEFQAIFKKASADEQSSSDEMSSKDESAAKDKCEHGEDCDECDSAMGDDNWAYDDELKTHMDESMVLEAGYNDAIAHLITASEALDKIGFEKTSSQALRLAEIIVTAKKVTKEDQKAKMQALREKAKAKKEQEKAKKEEMAAKTKMKKEKEKAKKEEMLAKEKAKKQKEKEMAEEKAKKMLDKAKEKAK